MNRYNHLNEYYKNKFGERVLKISIDGHFTCPNRDGTCGYGGCIFCDDLGSGLDKKNISIKDQVISHLNSYRGVRANKFIVYFQNFTNTYDSIENLKKKYDEALSVSNKIIGLSIATRPDCIDDNVANLLSQYKDDYYVQVELGLQTANDEIGKLINRGYDTKKFIDAVNILYKYNIDVVVHVMVGLPNESKNDIFNTINLINELNVSGIKIHSTYVVCDTKLAQMYLSGEYVPMEINDYIACVGDIISNLRPDIIIHRISGDAPKNNLIAPLWNSHKKLVLNGVEKYLENNDIYQGKLYKKEIVDK